MLIKATQKYTRQAPRKARLVANAVKNLSVSKAIEQLGMIERKASILILKVISQALANAKHNFGIHEDQLKIHSIVVESGPSYKRFRAVSRGRAHTILKRTSHVSVVLEAKETKTPVAKTKSDELKKVKVNSQNIVETKEELVKRQSVKKRTVDEMKASKAVLKPNALKLKAPKARLRNTTHK